LKNISICIPAFNDWSELERTLGSFRVLAESSVSREVTFEILISDNHSTDATEGMLAAWDFRGLPVTIFRQEVNLGFRGNLEFLCSHATGEWLLFMSCGDEIGEEFRIPELMHYLASSAESTVFFGFELFDQATLTRATAAQYPQNWIAAQSNVLFSPAPMPIFRRDALLSAIAKSKSISGNWWPHVEWALEANKKSQAASMIGHLDLRSHRPTVGWWTSANAYQSVVFLHKTLRKYQGEYKNPELLAFPVRRTISSLPAWVFQTKIVHRNRLGLSDIGFIAHEFFSAPYQVTCAVVLIVCPAWMLKIVRKIFRRFS